MPLILIVVVALLSAVSTFTDSQPRSDQLEALVDGTIVTMIKGWGPKVNEKLPIDVVIVADNDLREKFSRKYAALSKLLQFEVEASIGFNGQSYFRKASKDEVYVNRFFITGETADECTADWARVISTLGGSTSKITMKRNEETWKVVSRTPKATS